MELFFDTTVDLFFHSHNKTNVSVGIFFPGRQTGTKLENIWIKTPQKFYVMDVIRRRERYEPLCLPESIL